MKDRIRHFFKYMNTRERMLFIYIIGGVLPLIVVSIFLTSSTRNILIQQAKDSEQAELNLLETTIRENMRIVTDVSLKMYFDDELESLALTQYASYDAFIDAYRNYDAVNQYLNDYTHEIEGISIYVENDTIASSSRLVKVDEDIRNSAWYQKAFEMNGRAAWYYKYEPVKLEKYLVLVRLIKNTDDVNIGVLVIVVKQELMNELLSGREYETAFVLDNRYVVATNTEDTDQQELIELLQDSAGSSTRVQYKGEECVLTISKLPSDKSYSTMENEIALVSIHPYSDILHEINKRSATSIIIIIFAVICSFLLINSFSARFSHRVRKLREQMHKVAQGDFDIKKNISGHDEISDLYQDLYTMIDSMQQLLTVVYEEQLQKEQLNSRQKDVEFKMLASQINPHFLYNTLETIRMKARVNHQPDIEELVKMLAKIMRRNIQVGDTLVTFKSEIELVEYYLKIQQYRFGDRIRYQVDIRCSIDDYKIMPLLIQPIVENAFVHGLEQKEGGGEIHIIIENTDKLRIHVTDNGCGMNEEELKEIKEGLNDFGHLDRSHIGLSNVNQRIKLLYGEKYGLVITSKNDEGTSVVIELPRNMR